MSKRGYYRVEKRRSTRTGPIFEEIIRLFHAHGWSKSRIAREFRLNRRTVIRICKESASRLVKPPLAACTESEKLDLPSVFAQSSHCSH